MTEVEGKKNWTRGTEGRTSFMGLDVNGCAQEGAKTGRTEPGNTEQSQETVTHIEAENNT